MSVLSRSCKFRFFKMKKFIGLGLSYKQSISELLYFFKYYSYVFFDVVVVICGSIVRDLFRVIFNCYYFLRVVLSNML